MRGYFPTVPDLPRAPAWGRGAVAALLLVMLAGCAATSRGVPLPELSGWEERRDKLAAIPEWEFHGRIGVSAGEEGFNGKLRWWQNGDIFVASVSGPLGVGTVRIRGDDRQVSVTDERGELTELRDVEAELYRRYGWTIPVGSLRYWALGIPDPKAPAETTFGNEGELAQLAQRDWVVRIDEYREGGGQPMPRRMTATNLDTRVRLVIDNWIFY